MELFRDIAAVVGGILSFITLVTVLTKSGRACVKNTFKKNTKELNEINQQQSNDIEEIKILIQQVVEDLNLVKDGVQQQLRNIIKNIYYSYREEKKIPIYERKTADVTYRLYSDGFHSNSYITLLYQEICKWEIDSTLDRDIDEG